MITIRVDDRAYQAHEGENLLQECLSLGLDLPYFCWHPALGSVGSCRQCAVKQFRDESDTQGKIVMACMTPAAEGARISIDDPEARAFRAEVIEWLMTSHPHDCPVCDEGGECHLQDMTLMSGHTYRRYRGLKRTWRNQYLGPFVNHEMNRCIQCYRCVRYYRNYAGGTDLEAMSLRNQVYFGRHQDGVLESEFSGNLVEICPTGVFTDKTLKQHYTRKWDLQTAPSVCVHCSVGCNTIPGERYGTLRRVYARYNGAVNGYFLCDRGRFGYEFVNAETRLREIAIRSPLPQAGEGPGVRVPNQRQSPPSTLTPTLSRERERENPGLKPQALARIAALCTLPARVIGIGSPRATLEANFALRTLVGTENFYSGMSDRDARLGALILDILRRGPARTPSLQQVGQADAVLVLGEDVTNSAPLIALALRQSVRQAPLRAAQKQGIPHWDDHALRHAMQQRKGPLYCATPLPTRLDDIASQTFHAAPDDLARLGWAVAHAIDAAAPKADGLPEALQTQAAAIAQALLAAERPLVVSGTGCGSEAVIQAAANVARALRAKGRSAALCYALAECNSMGAALLGGKPLGAALQEARDGLITTAIVVENDLYRRADTAVVEGFLSAVKHVIVIDHSTHGTAARAELALPAGTFAESDGTLVNQEGRAQRLFQVFPAGGETQESWRWLRDILHAAGRAAEAPWHSLDQIEAACAAAIPELAPIVRAAPDADFRIDGMKVARETHRFSGRTAMTADSSVHERQPPPPDPDSPLAFTMEGYPSQPPPALIPIFWAPGWNSPQAINKFQQEVGGPLRGGDPGVRLVERDAGARCEYFMHAPPAFAARDGEHWLIPLQHIFGGEEWSVHAPGVAELAPRPYLMLNPADAEALGLRPDGDAELHLGRRVWRLPLKLDAELQPGVAGLPVGLPGLPGLDLPAWGRITPELRR
jgi:NADH-quinone oxidoreductase subunit G